jgi:hypothetical protein
MVRQSAELTRSPDVIGAEMAGGIVLLQMKTWTYLELNETGIEAWRLLARPQSLSSLTAALMAEFDVDEASCRSDTEAFVEDLAARSFLRVELSPQEVLPHAHDRSGPDSN